MKKDNREKHQHLAAFPCKLKILPHFIFNKRDPIICGVRVEDGFIKLGTPICIPSRDVCIDKSFFYYKHLNEFSVLILVE
jgi:translation initiation factor 5B